MGQLFRIVMLNCSSVQGGPLEFSLLIKPVFVCMLVGLNQTHSIVHSVFSSRLQIQVFTFFITCQSFFKERMTCLFIKTWFNCILLFEHFFTVTPKAFCSFFVIVTVFYIQRFFGYLDLINLEI